MRKRSRINYSLQKKRSQAPRHNKVINFPSPLLALQTYAMNSLSRRALRPVFPVADLAPAAPPVAFPPVVAPVAPFAPVAVPVAPFAAPPATPALALAAPVDLEAATLAAVVAFAAVAPLPCDH